MPIDFGNFDYWLILGPLLIFLARVLDVAIGPIKPRPPPRRRPGHARRRRATMLLA